MRLIQQSSSCQSWLQALLKGGARANAVWAARPADAFPDSEPTGFEGLSPLHVAAAGCCNTAFASLTAAGAPVDLTTDYQPPFYRGEDLVRRGPAALRPCRTGAESCTWPAPNHGFHCAVCSGSSCRAPL